MNSVKFSALRHAVKLKHEIELIELDIVEFLSGQLPDHIKTPIVAGKRQELDNKKYTLLKYVENNDLSKLIFEHTRIK